MRCMVISIILILLSATPGYSGTNYLKKKGIFCDNIWSFMAFLKAARKNNETEMKKYPKCFIADREMKLTNSKGTMFDLIEGDLILGKKKGTVHGVTHESFLRGG